MARTYNRLSPKTLDTLGPGLHHDGRGLYLQVKNGGRSWVHRYMLDSRPREMGLGPLHDVSLADARKKARDCRALAREGTDPIEFRRHRKQSARLDAARSVTFEQAATRYIEAHRDGWRNAKHAAQWSSSLETYAFPVFGKLPIQEVDLGLVLKVLEPIWKTKNETAKRVRMRIEAVLNWATVRGHRSGENPARWRGHLDSMLAKPKKAVHHKAMPFAELPDFFAGLLKRDNVSAKAMAFTILTAARSGETRLASLGELDIKETLWTVPGERTKSGREHRVPLTKDVIALLPRNGEREALLFPNPDGNPLSENAMNKYLKEDLGWEGRATVHGFRSTFKDWAAERTNFPNEVSEAALAHVVGDKTEAAYRRGDALDKRRLLMEAWAKYCSSGAATGGKIVPIRKA